MSTNNDFPLLTTPTTQHGKAASMLFCIKQINLFIRYHLNTIEMESKIYIS